VWSSVPQRPPADSRGVCTAMRSLDAPFRHLAKSAESIALNPLLKLSPTCILLSATVTRPPSRTSYRGL
jgi:hypothetical protein